jgi:hypothetical protein
MIFFLVMSVLGFIASVAAHFSTFFGINPQLIFPHIWLLHIFIFVVFGPAIFFCTKISARAIVNFNEIVSIYSPAWMKMLVIVFFAYAFFNFFFTTFVLGESGVPGIIDGKKVIHSHGRVIRELNDKEYEQQKIYLIRGASGHWMLFYSASVMMIYSCINADNEMKTSKKYGGFG